MKKLYCLLAMTLLLAFSGCNDSPVVPPPPDDDQQPLDQRLVGGRWYHFTSSYITYPEWYFEKDNSQGYYDFYTGTQLNSHETPLSKDIFGLGQNYSCSFYSKTDKGNPDKGIIFISDENELHGLKIMEYEFHDSWPYQNDGGKTYGINGYLRQQLDEIASEGNVITYRLFDCEGDLFDDGRYYYQWVLMRFPYE